MTEDPAIVLARQAKWSMEAEAAAEHCFPFNGEQRSARRACRPRATKSTSLWESYTFYPGGISKKCDMPSLTAALRYDCSCRQRCLGEGRYTEIDIYNQRSRTNPHMPLSLSLALTLKHPHAHAPTLKHLGTYTHTHTHSHAHSHSHLHSHFHSHSHFALALTLCHRLRLRKEFDDAFLNKNPNNLNRRDFIRLLMTPRWSPSKKIFGRCP
jgi:hypothetical protein